MLLADARTKARGSSAQIETACRAIKGFAESGVPGALVQNRGMGDQPFGGGSHLHHHALQFKQWSFVCINVIARRCAGQQVKIGRIMDPGVRVRPRGGSHIVKAHDLPWMEKAGAFLGQGQEIEVLPDHPALQFIQCPNPVQQRWDFTYSSVAAFMLSGLTYWLDDAGDDGQPRVWTVPAAWLTPKHTAEVLFDHYKLRIPGSATESRIEGEDVQRIFNPDPNNLLGHVSPVLTQLRAVLVDDFIQTSQQKAFENGIFPQVAIKIARKADRGSRRKLTGQQRRQMISAIRKVWGGVAHMHEPAILDGFIEGIEQLTRQPREMDWNDSAELVRKRLFQAFGVSPIDVGEVTNVNRAQAAVADKRLCNGVVNPILEKLSVAATVWLLPRFARNNERLVMWWEPCSPSDEELSLKKWEVALKHNLADEDEFRSHVLKIGPRDRPEDWEPRVALLDSPAGLQAVSNLLQNVGRRLVDPEAAGRVLARFLDINEDVARGLVGEPPDPAEQIAGNDRQAIRFRQRLAGHLLEYKRAESLSREGVRERRNELSELAEEEIARLAARFFPSPDG